MPNRVGSAFEASVQKLRPHLRSVVTFLPLIFALWACQSDEETLKRLNSDVVRAQLQHRYYAEKFDSLFRSEKDIGGTRVTGPLTDAYADSAVQAKEKLMLAERELNKFVGGR